MVKTSSLIQTAFLESDITPTSPILLVCRLRFQRLRQVVLFAIATAPWSPIWFSCKESIFSSFQVSFDPMTTAPLSEMLLVYQLLRYFAMRSLYQVALCIDFSYLTFCTDIGFWFICRLLNGTTNRINVSIQIHDDNHVKFCYIDLCLELIDSLVTQARYQTV